MYIYLFPFSQVAGQAGHSSSCWSQAGISTDFCGWELCIAEQEEASIASE